MDMLYRGRKVAVISIRNDGTTIVKDSKPRQLRMDGNHDYATIIVKTEQLKPLN